MMKKSSVTHSTFHKTSLTSGSFTFAKHLSIPGTIIICGTLGFFISTIQYDIAIVAEALSIGGAIAATYYTYTVAKVSAPIYRQIGAALMLVATGSYLLYYLFPDPQINEWAISMMTDIAIIYMLIVGTVCNRKCDHAKK
jgi:hypothetical protein